jgi:hypothetical protein
MLCMSLAGELRHKEKEITYLFCDNIKQTYIISLTWYQNSLHNDTQHGEKCLARSANTTQNHDRTQHNDAGD